MSESIWPVLPEQTSATASSSIQNTTQTAAPEPADRCGLQRDALRGILSEMKKQIQILQERQDALHKCMTGRSLRDTQPQVSGFNAAASQKVAVVDMIMALDRIAFATGIRIDGN